MKRATFEVIFYLFTIALVIWLAVIGGFSLSGFSESFQSDIIQISTYLGGFTIYTPLLFLSALIVIFAIANAVFIKDNEHPATQSNPSWARIFTVSYLYNPEDSFMWFLAKQLKTPKEIKWATNIGRVLFLSVLLFGAIALLQIFVPQLSVSGTPQTIQQISPTSDIIFGSGIPAVAENGSLLFIFFFLLGINAYICAKFFAQKYGKTEALWIFFLVGMIFIAPLMGYIWGSYHTIVYGNSEASLWATRLFGTLGAELIIMTGIFIWWAIWHFMNNLILKLLEYSTAKDVLAIKFGLFLFVILVLYIIFEIFIFKKRKGAEHQLVS